ncbi:MAG TPA: AraC family transcriptional regulator, partial [Verrucomicrobiae bacterium]|nr:AraC family transcriptional regulator [Verrucomicrobiae bacterium]
MKNPASSASAFIPPDYFSTQVSRARRFYLNLNPAPRTDLAVVSGGVEHCTPDYVIGRKSFPFYAV